MWFPVCSFKMLQLFAFFVLVMPAFVSAKDQDVANAPNNCEVNNYNNNFYAGPDKRVESLLRDMKTQLDELQRQVALLAKCRKPDTKGRYLTQYLLHVALKNGQSVIHLTWTLLVAYPKFSSLSFARKPMLSIMFSFLSCC